jgi:hypothetical protein
VRPLRAWSGRRVTLTALGWVLGLPALALLAAGVAVWRVLRPEQAATSGAVLPPQASDFIFSVSGTELSWLAVLLLGPPALLALAWWAARRRDRDRPT